jgi:hypothetical protein
MLRAQLLRVAQQQRARGPRQVPQRQAQPQRIAEQEQQARRGPQNASQQHAGHHCVPAT